MNIHEFAPEAIDIHSRLRAIDERKVEALAESMRAIGLLNPVTVVVSDDGSSVTLVAGAHRVSAARRLGWSTVPCVMIDASEMVSQLAEIDENLCRANLTPTQEAEHSARRQEIWTAMKAAEIQVAQPAPPEIGYGKPPQQSKGFAESTAAATGKSKSSINRAIHRAEAVCQEARDLIRGTKLDTGTFLDRLAKAGVSEREQVDRVREALDALADKEKADALKREADARRKAAKEDAYAACNEISAFLFEKLTTREWAALIDKFERAGWTTPAKSLRNWEPPQAKAA